MSAITNGANSARLSINPSHATALPYHAARRACVLRRDRRRADPSSEPDAEQVDRIAVGQALSLLLRQSAQMILDHLARMRKRHVEMRIVVGPHAILLAPPREEARAHVILEERAIDVLVEDLTRLALDGHRPVATE